MKSNILRLIIISISKKSHIYHNLSVKENIEFPNENISCSMLIHCVLVCIIKHVCLSSFMSTKYVDIRLK